MLRFPRNSLSGLSLRGSPREEEQTLAEATINGGMVTSVDEADLENNQFLTVKNATVRYDRTARRFGTEAFVDAAPDANAVLHLASYERFGGDVNLVRFTPSSIYEHDGSAWNALAAGVGGSLTGGSSDRFRVATINDRMFFTNNGADVIQEIDLVASEFLALGNAPRYRYLMGFNNRIVGANLAGAGGSTIQIGWSGNLNFDEWDSGVDSSAGSVVLIDTSADLSDNITGLFGFTDYALMLRERSVWQIAKQPVSSDPFTFSSLFPNIGCDSPYSAVAIEQGIAWFDIRKGTVYIYKVGDTAPTPIGRPIEKTLLSEILATDGIIFGSYNTLNDEYSLCVPDGNTDFVRIWTFNFRAKAWFYDEIENLTCLANVDYASQVLSIDQLTGFINDLTGTIDELGVSIDTASRFYGFSDGTITIENNLSDLDNGTEFTTEIVSKLWRAPAKKFYVQKFFLEYVPRLEGSFTISYSKDGGNTWTDYRTVTWDDTVAGDRKQVVCSKNINCSLFQWKLTSTDGLFELISYEIKVLPSETDQRSR